MSSTPQAAGQHLSLTIQLSEAPRGASGTRGTDYGTAVCMERDENGNCLQHQTTQDFDAVSISSI